MTWLDRRKEQRRTPEGRAAIKRYNAKAYAKRKASGEPLLTEAQRARMKVYRATPEGREMLARSFAKAKDEGKWYTSKKLWPESKKIKHRERNRKDRRTEKGKARSAAQCARRYAAGTVSAVTVQRILSARVCYYCGVGIEALLGDKKHPCKATLDHRVPISRGGRTEESNLVAACLACNLEKHTQTDEEFLGRAA